MKDYIITKLTSRKFLASVAGILTGIALIITGNTVEGAASVIASVLGYLAAEGYVDGKAVKSTIEITQDMLEGTEVDGDDGNGA